MKEVFQSVDVSRITWSQVKFNISYEVNVQILTILEVFVADLFRFSEPCCHSGTNTVYTKHLPGINRRVIRD